MTTKSVQENVFGWLFDDDDDDDDDDGSLF
jgi:hypothetical protein